MAAAAGGVPFVMMATGVELSDTELLERIEQRRSQCRRARSSFAVLHVRLVDVHESRARHGAAVTRALLGELGRRLKSRIRDTDEVLFDACSGFAVLLPGAGRAEAALVQARLEIVLAAACRVGGLVLRPDVVVEIGSQSIFEPTVAGLPSTGTAG